MKIDDSMRQRPVIGVHPIDLHSIHAAKDGGDCNF